MIFTEFLTGDATGFEVYGGLAACVHYLRPDGSDAAVAFRALSADDQKGRLIGATRYIEETYWQGLATGLAGGTATTLAFPRTGLTDVAGNPLDATNVPPQLVTAVFEMTALLAADPEAGSAVDSGSNVSSLGAGPAQIAFFRPTSARDGTATVMPEVVNRLVGRWRAAATAAAFAGLATGVNNGSNFLACAWCGSMATSTWSCCCAEQRRDVGWPL